MSSFLDSIPSAGSLNEEQAVQIWLAKWRGESIDYLLARFGIDENTVQKVWNCELFPGARQHALKTVWESDPELAQHMQLSAPGLEPQISDQHM